MKDLEGRKARIQVGSGEVFEIDSPKYSDEGAMIRVPREPGAKAEFIPCNQVTVHEVADEDGNYPAPPDEAGKDAKGGGDNSELVLALREALAAKGEDGGRVKELEAALEEQSKGFTAAFEKQRQELEALKKFVGSLPTAALAKGDGPMPQVPPGDGKAEKNDGKGK
jgi:hypothetical protein